MLTFHSKQWENYSIGRHHSSNVCYSQFVPKAVIPVRCNALMILVNMMLLIFRYISLDYFRKFKKLKNEIKN